MFQRVEEKAKQTVRSVALSMASGLLMSVGAGFLTVAAWIYLSVLADTLIAASVIGSAYLGIGLVFLALAKSKPQGTVTTSPRASHGIDEHHTSPTNAPPIMQAFLHGMQAGARAKNGQVH